MKRKSKEAVRSAVMALAAITISPTAIETTHISPKYFQDSAAVSINQGIRTGEISLGDFITKIKEIEGARGLVLAGNLTDLWVTNVPYKSRNNIVEYTAIMLIRAKNDRLFGSIRKTLYGQWRFIFGGSFYLPV